MPCCSRTCHAAPGALAELLNPESCLREQSNTTWQFWQAVNHFVESVCSKHSQQMRHGSLSCCTVSSQAQNSEPDGTAGQFNSHRQQASVSCSLPHISRWSVPVIHQQQLLSQMSRVGALGLRPDAPTRPLGGAALGGSSSSPSVKLPPREAGDSPPDSPPAPECRRLPCSAAATRQKAAQGG